MKFLPTILLLLPLLTACNSELDFGGDTPGTKNAAIGFSNNMKITRAEATLTEIQTNGFSVWGGYEDNTVFDGRKVTFTNSAWSYEPTEYWTYNIYDFHGVYPTPVANSTDKNYTVTWNNTTKELKIENFNASNNIDLLHAPIVNQNGQLATVTSQPVTMNFNHILTNVNIVLAKSTNNIDDIITITDVAIALPMTGDYSWQKGNTQWIVDNTFIRINKSGMEETLSSDNSDDDYYKPLFENMLCIPQEIKTNSITLQVKYTFQKAGDDDKLNREYYVTLPAGTWNPGDKVVYRGIIDAHMNIVFGAPTVEEWGEDMAGGTIIIK